MVVGKECLRSEEVAFRSVLLQVPINLLELKLATGAPWAWPYLMRACGEGCVRMEAAMPFAEWPCARVALMDSRVKRSVPMCEAFGACLDNETSLRAKANDRILSWMRACYWLPAKSF